jgi:hypothetical protein
LFVTRADKSEQARAQQQSQWRRVRAFEKQSYLANDAVSYLASGAVEYSGRYPSSFFLGARSTPKACLFSTNVPKIVTRDRIYRRRDYFICLSALCLAQIFGNFFIQLQQTRVGTNGSCRLRPFAHARGFLSWGHENSPGLFLSV